MTASTYDTLVHNGIVVTVNDTFDIFEKGHVGIRNGRIAAAGPLPDGNGLPPARQIVDARGGIIMPGLVNAHTHLPMSLFRGLADDLPLSVWLNEHIFPAEAAYIDADAVGLGTLLSAAEMLLSGTTACCDGYFLEDHVAAAVQQIGLRAVLGQGVIDFPAPGVPHPEENIRQAVDFVHRWQGAADTITPSIFCHSAYTCGPDTLRQAKQAAVEAGVLFQIHVAETRDEKDQIPGLGGRSPVRYLCDLGIVDPMTLLVHGVWLAADDINAIARSGAALVHNPQSNMKLAAGVCPVPALLAAGVRVALGTDGCASNNDLDLFQEMDTAAKLAKVFGGDPTALPARQVVRMATIEGARAIGLGDVTGSLEPGKLADLIVLDTAQPHLTPMYRPASHLVYAVRGRDVSHVWVGGRQVVADGNLLTVDLAALMQSVAVFGRRIRQRQP